jgi:hypothetical protein
MSETQKHWKEREEISINELEDMWFANRNLEMAKHYILAVKDFQKISLEEKLWFLRNVLHEKSNLWRNSDYEKLDKYIKGPLLETFLFLLPEWKQEFAERTETGKLILALLSHKDINFHISVSDGQIKKFVHSYLNSVKKEDMQEYLIVDVLISNRMFEELVNYNFVSLRSVNKLWNFIFSGWISCGDVSYYCLIQATLNGVEEYQGKVRELLFSWDKVENRHALATLWTLLAKRGDLEKIFGESVPQKDDDKPEKHWEIMEKVAKILKKEYPGTSTPPSCYLISDVVKAYKKVKQELEK